MNLNHNKMSSSSQSQPMKRARIAEADSITDFKVKKERLRNMILKHAELESRTPNKLKTQQIFFDLHDDEIAFDEAKHIYILRNEKQFQTSVTTFCKTEINKSDFNPVEIIQKMRLDHEDTTDFEFDVHAMKLCEWKFASLFGSLFHHFVETFIKLVINSCDHDECVNQIYNKHIYEECIEMLTACDYLSNDKCSQPMEPDAKLQKPPAMPCKYFMDSYDAFCEVVCDTHFLDKFLKMTVRYDMRNEYYVKDIEKTMETAFEVKKDSMTKACAMYRSNYAKNVTENYADSIYRVIDLQFNVGMYASQLTFYLENFKNVLMHLPIHMCCDIVPEYIVFNEEHGLVGSVDLVMRLRDDPRKLLVYDWKTSRNIVKQFWRGNNREIRNQLMDYCCQLHTYSNIIENSSVYRTDSFVVNVTAKDSIIYNVPKRLSCDCFTIFKNFHGLLIKQNTN